ncbi:MAG TPA: ATP-dependent helicase HrpB [Gammaproteobacteria bacterium]|nr:ATP-dependent helicase HrpB [Gammaproteobacteria bacterium]
MRGRPISSYAIAAVLPALREALLARRSAVLTAPPGAGKSTVVPLALLDEPWMRGRRAIMLEPRRLAARAVARRMADTLGEPVGRTVGHRMRLDTRVSGETRIEVVTEGVLTRMLQSDPALEGVALVIFDEFHERSLEADLGLALTLDARDAIAPDLRVLVMSATLEVEPVARLLGDAALVTAEGRAFAVETRYAGKGPPLLPGGAGAGVGAAGPNAAAGRTFGAGESPERLVASIVQRALAETEGDVLVFLPGAAEIRRVAALLTAAPLPSGVRLSPLFGDLDTEAQDAALAPAPEGARKVVLATNIAETSLTIEGVRVVVDSGLVRRALFDPSTGMGRLETRRISRASAEQRQGRAGRTAPGVCYRAWSAGAHASLAPTTPPEILAADLAPLALELASWGVADAGALRWLDAPPPAMLASARELLRRLGALDDTDRITEHGRKMARLGVHPRLAHMLLRSLALGALPVAAELAALLSERDLLRGDAASRGSAPAPAGGGPVRDADIRARLEALHSGRGDRGAIHRARRQARNLERQAAALGVDGETGDGRGGPRSSRARGEPDVSRAPDKGGAAHGGDALAGVLLAFAYPDRIARRRAGASRRYALSNGRGAELDEGERLAREEFLVAVDVDDRDRDARIRLAAPLTRQELEAHFSSELERAEEIEWNAREEAVVARRVLRLGALVVDEKPLPQVPPDAARGAMLAGVRALGLGVLPWTSDARDFQARVEFVRALGLPETADWLALDDAALERSLDEWLAPWLEGATRREHLARIPLLDALKAYLGWQRLQALDALAPSRIEVPSGSRIRVDYRDENAPVVAVRLQEVFGLEQTPRIGGGRVPVTFKLLSPAQRPVQITRDLESFWRSGYAEVRKDLRGRYPKHYWPENPLEAEAVRGVRPRG